MAQDGTSVVDREITELLDGRIILQVGIKLFMDTWDFSLDIYNRGPQAAGAYGGASAGGGSGLVTPDQYKAQKTQMNPNDPMQQQMMMMNMVKAYTQPILLRIS